MRTGKEGRLLFSATDLANYSACPRLTALERRAALGETRRPAEDSAMADLLSQRGDEHEQRYLDEQKNSGCRVAEIAVGSQDEASLYESERQTLEAMRSGADIVYQATFFDGKWGGRADFLRRVERPSDLGEWSYEVIDTKLARHVKPEALLQLAEYSHHVARLQGVVPARIHVVLGSGEEVTYSLNEVSAYHRRLHARFAEAIERGEAPPYPIPVRHCGICRWNTSCENKRLKDDHLSLVARMRRDQIAKLNDAGVMTVAELATVDPGIQVPRLAPLTFSRLHAQAELQVKGRQSEELLFEPLPVEPGRGYCLLPEPSAGDIFFDIEGDPLYEGGGLEYLLGASVLENGGSRFVAWWANDRETEKKSFEDFIDFVMARYEADPSMHVYHYADYEKAALKRLMIRHGTREMEVDRLLRGEVLVDLYAVVRGALRIGSGSYSLKTVERLYLPKREDAVKDATSSIVEYERWRATGDDNILHEIEKYNAVDCDSTLQLRDWLEKHRAELVNTGTAVPRPGEMDAAPSEQAQQAALRNVERIHAILEGRGGAGNLDAKSRWLLAQMVDWHQREDRPRWWDHFHRLSLSEEELIDDTTALGGLQYQQRDADGYHVFAFPAGQEHKLAPETKLVDPATTKNAGTVVSVDDARGVLLVKFRNDFDEAPRALIPNSNVSSQVLRDAVGRLVDSVLAVENIVPLFGGPTPVGSESPLGSAWEAGLALLQKTPPGDGDLRRGDEDLLDAARRNAAALDGGVLAIQGPPGSGKTYVGARVIVDLIARGQRIGITGPSHRAIDNLVREVAATARQQGRTIRVLQKGDGDASSDDFITYTSQNAEVEAALSAGEVDVVAGTPWLFARADMQGAVQTLVVDEAGQVPLANALAISGACNSMILLGDPQQLPQPAVGAHPEGASPSALEHLLDGHATMPADRGLFLDLSWRMHPAITSVVSELSYESRLHSHPSCEQQCIGGDDELGGSGIRFVPVQHQGNRVASDEEAAAVAQMVAELLRRQWRDRHGNWSPITLDDILIVAPFNAHVARLSGVLPAGARIGSVDRFQGQEAAVVIFTLGTSSADDAPRGLEFLFNLNRLNVALSRGRALSVIVAAPQLLDAHCNTAEQVKLVNALCRCAEVASAAPAVGIGV